MAKKKRTTPSWHEQARHWAKDAYQAHFPSRRGIFFVEAQNVLVLYNNNPWARHRELRELETAEFRRSLAAAGIKELAYATYPLEGGKDAGYTYAMILDASEDKIEWVANAMERIVAASMAWLRKVT